VTWLENARGLASSLVGSEIRQTMNRERKRKKRCLMQRDWYVLLHTFILKLPKH